jgi:hypothetical protein
MLVHVRNQDGSASLLKSQSEAMYPETCERQFAGSDRVLPTGHRTVRFNWVIGAVLLISLLSGCASHYNRVWVVREEFHAGHLDLARAAIDTQLKKHKGESDVFLLDKAMIELTSGNPKEAEKILRGVRDR